MGPVRGSVIAKEAAEDPRALYFREKLIEEFKGTSLSGIYPRDPPVRGPFGEAEINLKPGAEPVSVPPYRIAGERHEAHAKLVDEGVRDGKLELGKGAWNTPSFPVPKKKPGAYRLVQDFRPQNEATLKDGHTLPRIHDILQRQWKCMVWTVLDLVDGFHQMPLKKEHRHITCMSTPRGTMQWTVNVMGLKNAGSQFQRMMEWVLKDHPTADAYIDDIIIGTVAPSWEECIEKHYHEVRAVLLEFQGKKMVCHSDKSDFFQKEVEFCGHLVREGARRPSPGKLLPIQKLEVPGTVSELRGFLGLTNYVSEYVDHYAEAAAPLMEKLKVGKEDVKKGSKVKVKWTAKEIESFEALKNKLAEKLELFQVDMDKPFILHCDASDHAIGAELCQKDKDGVERPVGFSSRKMAKIQMNWTPR